MMAIMMECLLNHYLYMSSHLISVTTQPCRLMSPSEPHSGVEAMSIIKETLLHAEQPMWGERALMKRTACSYQQVLSVTLFPLFSLPLLCEKSPVDSRCGFSKALLPAAEVGIRVCLGKQVSSLKNSVVNSSGL